MSAATTSFYVPGGTLGLDAPSYVERRADRELYDGLCRGQFCYALTARQMGKSSLMVRTAARLRDEGVAVAVLDLTNIGQNLSPEQWYDGLLALMGQQLDLEAELEEFWLDHPRLGPLQRWIAALREVVLARIQGRLVIFVDEIDAVRSLPFSTDEFFAGIRQCYNRRSEDPEFERLTFCLLGVATPSDLIRDTRTTPFNIGRRIELTDFTEAEAAPLAEGLLTSPPAPLRHGEGSETEPRLAAAPTHSGPPLRVGEGLGMRLTQPEEERVPRKVVALLQRILYWTGGHPYLTQRLCQAIAEDATVTDPAGVDQLCQSLFLSHRARERDDNLLFVRERLLRSEVDLAGLLDLYARVWRDRKGGVPDDETNPLVSLLRLSGITRSVNGSLRVRNRIYGRVFDFAWIAGQMPDAELRRQRAAYRRGLLRATAVFVSVLAMVGALAFLALVQARRANEGQRALRRHLYAAQMSLAQQAWNAGNVGRALELVEAQEPKSGQEDLRGFEWRYLWRLCQGDVRFTLRGHQAGVTSVAFSRDGAILASGSDDGTVKLWDVAARRELATLARQSALVHVVRFSPDGKTLASGAMDGSIRLWDLTTRREIARLRSPQQNIWHLDFSPDGKLLAADGWGKLTVWDLAARREIARLTSTEVMERGVAFSPRSRLLALIHHGVAHLWDLDAKRTVAVLPSRASRIKSLAFAPDGRTLTLGSYDGTIELWNVATKREFASLKGHTAQINALSFSPDGKSLATCSDDLSIRLWDTATKQQRSVLRGHAAGVWDLAFSPDGKMLASASSDRTVKLWNAAPGHEEDTLILPGHAQEPLSVAFSPDGRLLASGGREKRVTLWNLVTRRGAGTLQGQRGEYQGMAFSPDGKLLAFGESNGRITLWDVASRQVTGALRGHGDPVSAVAFSPDGRLMAAGRPGSGAMALGEVKLWDIPTRRELATLPRVDPSSVAFSPDGRLLAVGSAIERKVRRWEVATRRQLAPLQMQTGWLSCVAFSPDGRLLAAGSMEGTMRVWDADAGSEVASFQGHRALVNAVTFSPDGKTVATGSEDRTVKLWNVATWQEVATFSGHTDTIIAVAFSPDGNTLASVSTDHTVRLWRAARFAETDGSARAPGD